MALVEISVIPIGTKTPSISQYIAGVLNVLEKERISYELTSMGTIVEGDLGRILSLVGRMHEAAFSGGILRVVTTLKIDDRRDKASTWEGKVISVREKLNLLRAQ